MIMLEVFAGVLLALIAYRGLTLALQSLLRVLVARDVARSLARSGGWFGDRSRPYRLGLWLGFTSGELRER